MNKQENKHLLFLLGKNTDLIFNEKGKLLCSAQAIIKLFKAQNQDLIDKIEKMDKKITGHESIGQDGFLKGYNQALKDIIKEIKGN